MKNKLWIFVLIFLIFTVIIGFYFFINNKQNNDNNYTATKSSVNKEIEVTDKSNYNDNILVQPNLNNTLANAIPKKEELICSFLTKIYSKDSARQNNISITCSTLNGTIVSNGSTFSFCDIVGQATSSKGYQEADIFDKDGNKKKGLGGGNCQVSTTLYNAVLQVPQLSVVERHEHSNKVPYIESGKDAAVAYGSYDLKFRNDTGFDIKLKVENTTDSVSVSLYKII